jgi:arsenate reductase
MEFGNRILDSSFLFAVSAQPRIVIYQKPTCTTCRQVYAALKESGVPLDSVDYYLEPLSKAKLQDLLRKMGIGARDLLRTREEIYRHLELGERVMSDDELVDLMVKHPDLIQRPIVEKGERAILARPAERLREIL